MYGPSRKRGNSRPQVENSSGQKQLVGYRAMGISRQSDVKASLTRNFQVCLRQRQEFGALPHATGNLKKLLEALAICALSFESTTS